MANEIGSHNPFIHGTHGTSGTNPFANDWQTHQPEHHYGNQVHDTPEGLSGRAPSSEGSPRPRVSLHAAPHAHGGPNGGPHGAMLDENTQNALAMQERQTANSTALAMATAEATIAQGLNEFLKSMAEQQAKALKSAGEKPASLA
jgi:hypothetical protein